MAVLRHLLCAVLLVCCTALDVALIDSKEGLYLLRDEQHKDISRDSFDGCVAALVGGVPAARIQAQESLEVLFSGKAVASHRDTDSFHL
jgi:hypothetical protein